MQLVGMLSSVLRAPYLPRADSALCAHGIHAPFVDSGVDTAVAILNGARTFSAHAVTERRVHDAFAVRHDPRVSLRGLPVASTGLRAASIIASAVDGAVIATDVTLAQTPRCMLAQRTFPTARLSPSLPAYRSLSCAPHPRPLPSRCPAHSMPLVHHAPRLRPYLRAVRSDQTHPSSSPRSLALPHEQPRPPVPQYTARTVRAPVSTTDGE